MFFRRFPVECVEWAKGRAGAKVQRGDKKIGKPQREVAEKGKEGKGGKSGLRAKGIFVCCLRTHLP